MRVTYVEPGKHVDPDRSLGPLLYEATTGVMDVDGQADRRRVAADARLSRRRLLQGGADKLAPAVDEVLAEQMKRFRTYATARPRRR